jgi:hypothetical protein
MIKLVSSKPLSEPKVVLAVTLLMCAVLACAAPRPTATPTANPTLAPQATASDTLQPTELLTATPSATALPQPTGTQTATPSATLLAEPTPTTVPTRSPTPSLGVAQVGGRLGGIWNLADVRYALHPDRLRFVLEMVEARDHVPFYRVVQVDNIASPFPTGHDPTWGVARIDLLVSDLYAYDPSLLEVLPIVPPDNPRVTRIGQYPTFEDSVLGFSIGLKSVATFQLREMTDPVRLVIDVLW